MEMMQTHAMTAATDISLWPPVFAGLLRDGVGHDAPNGHVLRSKVECVRVAQREGLRRGKRMRAVGSDLLIRAGVGGVFIPALLLVSWFAAGGDAAASTLKVASCADKAHERPPYVLTEAGGKGFEIELWERIHREMVFRAASLGDSRLIGIVGDEPPPMMTMSRADIKLGLKSGTVEVGVCAIAAEQSNHMAFAHPHLQSGLRAVVKLSTGKVDFVQVLVRGIFRPFTNVYAQAALLLILYFAVLIAHIVWVLERKDNSQQFNLAYGPGIIDSLWWALVTALTVGYGDKFNTTIPSKLVAIVWMILSAFFVGIFAAALTSSFLVGSLDQSTSVTIAKVSDLSLYKVGVASDVAVETIEYETKGTALTRYEDEFKLLQALQNGDIEVAVQDSRTAQYMANKVNDFIGKIRPIGITFGHVDMSFAVAYNGSYHPVHKIISDSVLEVVTGSGKSSYDELSLRWLGTDEFLTSLTGGNAELEQALAQSNRVAALVLAGLAFVWACAVFLHMKDEIREEQIRNKLRLTLGLSKRFNMLQVVSHSIVGLRFRTCLVHE